MLRIAFTASVVPSKCPKNTSTGMFLKAQEGLLTQECDFKIHSVNTISKTDKKVRKSIDATV
jgi:hypothetical protein